MKISRKLEIATPNRGWIRLSDVIDAFPQLEKDVQRIYNVRCSDLLVAINDTHVRLCK